MKIYIGELLLTEICVEGIELGFEFESSHCESSELILKVLKETYNKNGDFVQNIYYNSKDYIVVLVKGTGSKYTIPLDMELFKPYSSILERDLSIIY